MLRTCARCKNPFDVPPRHPHQRLCSRRCNGRVHPGETYGVAPVFACAFCGKETPRRRSRFADGRPSGHDYGQKYCSKECGYKGRRRRPISQEGYVHSSGYIRLDLPGGKKMYQHKKVMEETLGRPLRKGESVHHKNGQRADNRPENLELWSEKQPPGQRVIDKVDFAIDMLLAYPEFAAAKGYKLVANDVDRPGHISDAAPGLRRAPC